MLMILLQSTAMNDDAVSVAMFLAGLLMVFTPIVSAGLVIGIWYHQKKKAEKASGAVGR